MYVASLQNFLRRIQAATESAWDPSAPLDQALTAIFDVLIDLYTTRTDAARGCLVVCTAATEAPTHENVERELVRVLAHVDASFAALLEAARQRGELGPDVDVDTLAAVLAGMTHSLAVRARAGEGAERLKRLAAAAVELLGIESGAADKA